MIRNNIYFWNRDIEFLIFLVIEYEIWNKLLIVIYRCLKIVVIFGFYFLYELIIDLVLEVLIEIREILEIFIVISDIEILIWDKNLKLN